MAEIIQIDFARVRRPKKPKGDLECTIRQSDLEEIMELKSQTHELLTALRERQDYVGWHLLNGTPVEGGKLTARMIKVNRQPRQIQGATFYRLLVK